ncbi:keratin-associated protein 5-1-like [Rosa chinensis]|uniref:keratin-associated protein 5-1-like n=1 Tax=Rosa chinensis TaxID=74649 RepID=UPI000D092E86|nr:keratin-associated protein 5-1-like [Rosa chinensis]
MAGKGLSEVAGKVAGIWWPELGWVVRGCCRGCAGECGGCARLAGNLSAGARQVSTSLGRCCAGVSRCSAGVDRCRHMGAQVSADACRAIGRGSVGVCRAVSRGLAALDRCLQGAGTRQAQGRGRSEFSDSRFRWLPTGSGDSATCSGFLGTRASICEAVVVGF